MLSGEEFKEGFPAFISNLEFKINFAHASNIMDCWPDKIYFFNILWTLFVYFLLVKSAVIIGKSIKNFQCIPFFYHHVYN